LQVTVKTCLYKGCRFLMSSALVPSLSWVHTPKLIMDRLPTVPNCNVTGFSSCVTFSFTTHAKSCVTKMVVQPKLSRAYAPRSLTLMCTAMQWWSRPFGHGHMPIWSLWLCAVQNSRSHATSSFSCAAAQCTAISAFSQVVSGRYPKHSINSRPSLVDGPEVISMSSSFDDGRILPFSCIFRASYCSTRNLYCPSQRSASPPLRDESNFSHLSSFWSSSHYSEAMSLSF